MAKSIVGLTLSEMVQLSVSLLILISKLHSSCYDSLTNISYDLSFWF